MTEENYYVGIDNPVEVRKDILEASKEVIINLQTFEDLRDIRIEKLKSIENFKHEVSGIQTLVRRLRRHFPKKYVQDKKLIKSSKRKSNLTKSSFKKQNLSQFEDELTSLEKEISSIK